MPFPSSALHVFETSWAGLPDRNLGGCQFQWLLHSKMGHKLTVLDIPHRCISVISFGFKKPKSNCEGVEDAKEDCNIGYFFSGNN